MKRSSSAYAFRIQWILEMGLWVRDGGGEAEVSGVMPARLLGIEGGFSKFRYDESLWDNVAWCVVW